MKTKYQNGQLAYIQLPKIGHFSGCIRKIKGRWWFVGDICRSVKVRMSELKSLGGRLVEP